jgi:hypothetical protein
MRGFHITGKLRPRAESQEAGSSSKKHIPRVTIGKVVASELWALSDFYDMQRIKEWLMKHAITAETVCAAINFAHKHPKEACKGLLEACREIAMLKLPRLSQDMLEGVGYEAARDLLQAHSQNPHLTRRCDVAEGFRFVERWYLANKSRDSANESLLQHARELIYSVYLKNDPHLAVCHFVKDFAERTGLVQENDQKEKRRAALKRDKNAGNKSMKCVLSSLQIPELKDMFVPMNGEKKKYKHTVGFMAVTGTGDNERLAVVDAPRHCVRVLSLSDKSKPVAQLFMVGSKGKGPEQFMNASGVTFNARGELFVSDCELHRISVFSDKGVYLRSFGSEGQNIGELDTPKQLALSSTGDILVCDAGNNRVQSFRDDGSSPKVLNNMHLDNPWAMGVASDGSLVVAVDIDNEFVLHMLSVDGSNPRPVNIPRDVPFNLRSLPDITVSRQGELILTDDALEHIYGVCVTTGELLWSRKCDLLELSRIESICMDSKGRILCVGMKDGENGRTPGNYYLSIWE